MDLLYQNSLLIFITSLCNQLLDGKTVRVQEKLGLPKYKFVKHLDVQWLTLSQAIDRILEQWGWFA